MLFSNDRKHKIQIPARDKDNTPVNVGYLVRHLCDHTMQDKRKELFVLDGSM
jgi:ubiquitin related modifier 1